MIIDIVFLILVVIAFFKGISKGFVLSVFSFVGIIVGIAAAMKLSYLVSEQLAASTNISTGWLPFLSFIIIILLVGLIVRWLAFFIKKALRLAMLGWADRLGGVLLFLLLYITIYSVILFYLSQMQLIKPETIAASRMYNIIQPFGPKAVSLISSVIPFFKDAFSELEGFFENISNQYKEAAASLIITVGI